MASDRLISSQSEQFVDPNDARNKIRVWVKRHESGRVRVVLDTIENFEVKAVVNGGNSDAIKLELVPS